MTDASFSAFLRLVSGRRGHFQLESGLHGGLWLDLDPLFLRPDAVAPFIDVLAEKIRPHGADIICGPLLGGAFVAQHIAEILRAEFCFAERQPAANSTGLFSAQYSIAPTLRPHVRGKRVAIVDDVMSAGSSLRATLTEMTTHGAQVIAAGALVILGDTGCDYFTQKNIPVEYTNRDAYEFWPPESCPMCAKTIPLERP